MKPLYVITRCPSFSQNGSLNLDVSKSNDAFMRRLRQMSRPTGFNGLASNLPPLVI